MDAILECVAYHCKDFDLSVIWFSPREHLSITNSISTPFSRVPDASLKHLDRLPMELLHQLCLQLDIFSLLKFRQVNLRSRQVVDSLHEYRITTLFGLTPLCAILRTKLAVNVTISDFYDILCTKDCSLCGGFAGFIFLPTWIRCCFKCLQQAPETQMQTLAFIRKQLSLSRQELLQLRAFQPLPGVYTMNETPYKSRIKIVSTQQAVSVLKREIVDTQQTLVSRSSDGPIARFNFMASCALPYLDRDSGLIEYGVSCAGCQLALEKRFWDAPRDEVYSKAGFLEHFKWCRQAQLLWLSSKDGTFDAGEKPEWIKKGGFFSSRE